MAGVAAIAVAINFVDAMTSNTRYFEARRTAEALGHWVEREFPAPPVLVGPMDITPIVSYYSHNSPYQTFRWEAGDETILRIVADHHAGVVLLPPGKLLKPERCAALDETHEGPGAGADRSARLAAVVRRSLRPRSQPDEAAPDQRQTRCHD